MLQTASLSSGVRLAHYEILSRFVRKRAIIESVMDQLESVSQIEHSRHRSVANSFVNLLAGLIAYTYLEKKPSLIFKSKSSCSFRHLFPESAYVELTFS